MSDLERVANFRTKVQAEAAAAVLEENGVAVLIQSQEGWSQSPISSGATILVAPADAARARELLEAFATDDD